MGPFGTCDMAGNVKEWCWNSAGTGKRYVLGGAWDEREYQFSGTDIRAAIARDTNMGFRCVKSLPGLEPPPTVFAEVKPAVRNFLAEPLLSDDAFQVAKGMFAYDKKKPLNPVDGHREETVTWLHERVAVDAAYGKERLLVHVFLPRDVTPPYQPVIYWPSGAAMFRATVSPRDECLTFIIHSGRALICPVFKGTYERKVAGMDFWEKTVQKAKDLGRSIDYLESRTQDFDLGALGYYGVSWGAAEGGPAVAIEERIKAAVLFDGGLTPSSSTRPERNAINYLARITIPVLMLNGRFDAIFPPDESQVPMFKLLGTDPSRKSHRLTDSSHIATISPERIQETVSWFDTYLGPVQRKGNVPE
jgi:pimeloyl-ACP methyl ester carboxylesterase